MDRWLDRAYSDLPNFLKSFIPIITWLPKYNKIWLLGDIISGFTVGIMLVPQSIAYSKLAQIPVQHGLYSSFIGNLVYAIFGGSREIAAGPNAVLSLLIGSAVNSISSIPGNQYTAAQIGSALATMFAFISMGLGVLKLGLILDLIPNPVIVGFTTGAASTIMLSQLPSMLGIPNVVNSKPTWEIIADIVMNIPKIKYVSLLFGIFSLAFLFLMPYLVSFGIKRYPFLSYLVVGANALAVVLFTLVSFGVKSSNPTLELTIVGDVPQGFGYIGAPPLGIDLWQNIISYSPAIFLVAILEHTAVCKNFSTKIGYQVSTSQEFFAVGAANLLGSFFSSFPVAGSLSRGAVLSKSGVRTPMVGIFIAIVLLAALLFLTPAFYYIPTATLGAIIMRAGISLIPTFATVKELYVTSKIDFFVFIVASVVTFLLGVQYGIGSAVAISFLYLLLRIARPKFYVLGEIEGRDGVFVDKYHPAYKAEDPEPGVIVFRIQESVIFPNISFLKDQLMDYVLEYTKSGAPPTLSKDKLWSSDLHDRSTSLRRIRAKRNNTSVPNEDDLPYLKAVILDLGAVNYIDASGIQGLKELRDQLYLYAGAHPSQLNSQFSTANPEDMFEMSDISLVPTFELHFVSIHMKVLRSLMISGLPSPLTYKPEPKHDLKDKTCNMSEHHSNKFTIKSLASVIEGDIDVNIENNNYFSNINNNELAMSLLEEGEEMEPILLNSSKYIHITLSGAISKVRENLKPDNVNFPPSP
ncbi:sulfate permease [Neoconidiobolus thromboides FSU 785]|nr:sulfate permease [Neoconidiobolus thromboides FSU 785]